MNMEIWHIEGMRFHFGRHGLGQEKTSSHFSSDSLFAALVARVAVLQGQTKAKSFGERFSDNKPPFVLSSAFPRAGEILFFPPPQTSTKPMDVPGAPKPKKLKQVRYVSEGLFRILLNGKTLAEEWKTAEKYHDKKVLLTKSEVAQLSTTIRARKEPMWKVTRQPRVTIDRAANNSTIYHTGQVVFNRGCGLWFGLRWLNPDPELEAQLPGLFAELGHAGLGGERSSGFGTCKIAPAGSIQLPEAANKPWVSLSRYIPNDNEIPALEYPQAAYKIESVEGWVKSTHGKKDERRKTAHMLVEGSVLGPLEADAPGQMVDAQPSYGDKKPLGHTVWRNGITLGVGLNPHRLIVTDDGTARDGSPDPAE